MALAELNTAGVVEDLRVYLGLPEGGYDVARGQLIVDLALARVENILSPVPALARAVVLDVAARGYDNPTSSQSQAVGPFQKSYKDPGVYLTEREEAQLRAIAAGDSASAAFTIRPGGHRRGRALDAAPGPW